MRNDTDHSYIPCRLLGGSQRAIRVEVRGTPYWVPKSICRVHQHDLQSDTVILEVEEWWERKELSDQ